VYVVQMDIPQHLEAEFNRIYDEDHVPTILKVPGVRSCARYRLEHSTIPTMPRYLAIYEVDRAEIINSPAWQEASDLGEWKPKIRPHTTNRQHSVFHTIARPGARRGDRHDARSSLVARRPGLARSRVQPAP